MNRIYTIVPLGIINLLSLIASVITIGMWIAAIIGFVLSKKVQVVIILIAIAATSLVVIAKLFKYRKLSHTRLADFSNIIRLFNQQFKESYFDMISAYKSCNRVEDISGLTRVLKSYMMKRLDELCDLFEKITEEKCDACIKLIVSEGDNKFDYDNSVVKTFVRSSQSRPERNNNDQQANITHYIKDNTDFHEIIGSDRANPKPHMYLPNIQQYAEGLKKVGKMYRNTTENWSDFYRSAIIVPIRMEIEKICNEKGEQTYHVIGFLCIDSMSTKAFLRKQEAFYVDILIGYAEHMYVLFNNYKFFQRKIKEKQSEE